MGAPHEPTDVRGTEMIAVATITDNCGAAFEKAWDTQDRTCRTVASETPPSPEGTDVNGDGGRAADEVRVESPTQWELLGSNDTGIVQEPPDQVALLADLAARIAGHRVRMERARRVSLERCFRIGEALIRAKELAGHGRWAQFLEDCDLKPRTAQQYMRIAREREQIEREAHGRADLTIEVVRKMIASKSRGIASRERNRAADGSNAGGMSQNRAHPGPDPLSGYPPRGGDAIESTGGGPTVGGTGEPEWSPCPIVTADEATGGATAEPLASLDRVDEGAGPEPQDSDSAGSGPEASGGDALPAAAGGAAPLPTRESTGQGPDERGDSVPAGRQNSSLAPGTAGAVGEADPPATAPDETSDDEWLASIPLRAKIRDKRYFDEEAILWRRLQPEFARIRQRLGASAEEVGKSAYLHPEKYRLRVRLVYAIHVRPPHEWELCDRCGGRCSDATGGLPCTRCHGWGFFIEHEGKVQDDEGGGDGSSEVSR